MARASTGGPTRPPQRSTDDAPKLVSNFVDLMRRQSDDAMLSASRFVAALRDAKSLEDVIAVQSKSIQRSAEDYANMARQLSDLLLAVPVLAAPMPRTTRSSAGAGSSPLAMRFETLVAEAESGLTEPVTGLPRDERRKALFGIE